MYHVCSIKAVSASAILFVLLGGCGPVSGDDVCVYKRNGKTVCRQFGVLGPNSDLGRDRMSRGCGGNTLPGGTDPRWERVCPLPEPLRMQCSCLSVRTTNAFTVSETYSEFTQQEIEAACQDLAASFQCE